MSLRALFGDQSTAFAGGSLPERRVLAKGSVDRLPEVMRSGDASSFKRLCQVYRGQLQMAGGPPGELRQVRVEGPRAEQIVAMGLTAYFYDILPSVPALGAWRRQLASELGVPSTCIRCAAWASPNAGGLSPHFDRYEGIIVQIAGEKLYRIGPNRRVKHSARQWSPRQPFDLLDVVQFDDGIPPDGCPEDLEEVLLEPGSVLFLPRGYWHGTKASGESFSLSIRLDPPILADVVLAQLRLSLLKDEAWRRPAYGAWGDAEGKRVALELLEDRLRTLPAALSQLSADSAFAIVEDVADQFKHVTPATSLCRVWTKAVAIEPSSSLVRGGSSPSKKTVGHDEATVVVSIHDTVSYMTERLEISSSSEPILRWLGEVKGLFTLGDVEAKFPEFDSADLRALAQAMAQKGAIVVIPFKLG